MDIQVAEFPGYTRILVEDREGVADAMAAVQRILAALEASSDRRALIVVKRSDPIFKVDSYQLSDAIARAAGLPGTKIALVGDTPELVASYEYVELLARQKNLDARAFRNEGDAIRWLCMPEGETGDPAT